jgi:hypothetical protein
MRSIVLVLIAFMLCLSPLFAQQSPLELMTSSPVPGPWDDGMFTGFVIDVIGYGLFVAGGLVTSMDLTTGIVLFDVGALSMTIGGTVWTTFMSQKHDAYSLEGISLPEDKKSLSWTLVWCSVGCMGGSIVAPLIIPDFTGGLISILLAGAAGIIETCNAWLVRIEWNPQMNDAYRAKHAEGPEVTPVITAAYDPSTKGFSSYVGVSIAL